MGGAFDAAEAGVDQAFDSPAGQLDTVGGNDVGTIIPLGLLVAALVGLGIGAVPLATRIPAVHWSEWVAAMVGLLAGWCLASFAVRFDNGNNNCRITSSLALSR